MKSTNPESQDQFQPDLVKGNQVFTNKDHLIPKK